MNSNFLLNNNNMSQISTLIKNEIKKDIETIGKQNYHPTIIFRGGEPTKKALAYNRKLLKENRITKYLDPTKFFNADTGKIKTIKFDNRYKTPTVTKAFKKKYELIDQVYATKKPTMSFRYVADDVLAPSWSVSSNSLYNNDLLRSLINQNNITGNYRIIIKINNDVVIDNSYNIDNANSFWKNNKIDFQVDSAFMIWNNDLNEGDVVTIIFTKEFKLNKKHYIQKYLDGKVSHCLLKPIKDWAYKTLVEAKSKDTKKKYMCIISKLEGRTLKSGKKIEGYFEQYKKGIPETDLDNFCDDLQIGIDIEQPFNEKLLFTYRSTKKPLKVFQYINTRINHVEIGMLNSFNKYSVFKTFEPEYVEDLNKLKKIQSKLDDNDEYYIITKSSYGISSIRTLDKYYKIKSPYDDAVKAFEKVNNLQNTSINALEYPELDKFINSGLHFNGTVDFEETEHLRIEENRPKDLKHIDMSKAYTQHKKCKYYKGFMVKITDFRKCDDIVDIGLYYIDNLNFDLCHNKFRLIINDLGWFKNGNVYTDAEIRCLRENGGTCDIKYGVWGIKNNIEYTDDMINKKQNIKLGAKEINVPFYSKWAGMNCSVNKMKNFYLKGDKAYFMNYVNSEADIHYANNEARISYPNYYQYHKKHITAQITAFQRLLLLEQLLKMDYEKIIRVCCDGIYYHDHKFNIDETFSHKVKVTFNNDECENYLSNLIQLDSTDFKCNNKFRHHYKSEIFDGAGGDGKTYGNLFIDKGFINVVYAPHSNKLMSAMSNKYFDEFGKKLNVTNHHRLLNNPYSLVDCNKYNVYIIDECSMITENQKEFLLKNIQGKIIFCGDLKAQCEPVDCEAQMTYKNIDNVAPKSPKNYRFKDDIQLDICNYVRDCIINNKDLDFTKIKYQKVNKNFVKNNYSKEDIILVSEHKFNDEWTETFKDIKKYRVKNNTRDYSNGDIIFDEEPEVDKTFIKGLNVTIIKEIKNQKSFKGVQKELRHGYTIHSVQGETFKNKIFIDMRRMKNKKVFYTAISRAEYSSQIYLII